MGLSKPWKVRTRASCSRGAVASRATYDVSAASRALFCCILDAAREWSTSPGASVNGGKLGAQ